MKKTIATITPAAEPANCSAALYNEETRQLTYLHADCTESAPAGEFDTPEAAAASVLLSHSGSGYSLQFYPEPTGYQEAHIAPTPEGLWAVLIHSGWMTDGTRRFKSLPCNFLTRNGAENVMIRMQYLLR